MSTAAALEEGARFPAARTTTSKQMTMYERTHPTRNDLDARARAAVVVSCNARLAEAVDLQTHAKHAHWNIRGPAFAPLHAMFDDLAKDLAEYADLMAERVVQLGGVARGTARLAVATSELPEHPLDATTGREHLEALATGLAFLGRTVRRAIDEADDLCDKGTADLFTEVSRGVDRWLWFVEAHLHPTP